MENKNRLNTKGNVSKMIKDILKEDGAALFDHSLLKELQDYKPTIINPKARRIYIKCIKAGKLELAYRIDRKYNLTNTGDDMFMAFSIALLDNNKK